MLVFTPLCSLVRVCPKLVLQMSKADNWDYSKEHYWYEFCLPRPTHVPIVSNILPFCLIVRVTVVNHQIPLQSLWYKIREVTPILGRIGCSSRFLLSHWRNQRLRDISLPGLGAGQYGQHAATSTFLMQSFLAKVMQDSVLQPHPQVQVLGFSQWFLILE